MKARHYFLADTLDVVLGLRNKELCDIGAGEGRFLNIVRSPEYGAQSFGIEPSPQNCRLMLDAGIPNVEGTIEDYLQGRLRERKGFDIVTMMWTLENCESPRAMLDGAYQMLKEGGHILLATGSRILVPFKKPLNYYISDQAPMDTHSFRFSANTQRGILAECGFETVFENRYIDHDVLCTIARKTDRSRRIKWEKDDYREIIDYFERWSKDTKEYFPKYVEA